MGTSDLVRVADGTPVGFYYPAASVPETMLAVDPGKKVAGATLWRDSSLVGAWLVQGSDPLDVARNLFEIVQGVDVLVTEDQQVYGGIRKEDPNDLLPLSFCCGAVHALVKARTRVKVLPRLWTKGTPKEVRIARLENEATPEETSMIMASTGNKKLRENVWDSFGLARWYLKQKVN